jgi:hypothetical protein
MEERRFGVVVVFGGNGDPRSMGVRSIVTENTPSRSILG